MTDATNRTNQTDVTRAELAKQLGCSYSTIRKYEREFGAWLKTPPGISSQGVARHYLAEDVKTLTAVHALRVAGVSFEDLKAGELDKALASATWTHTPEQVREDEGAQANAGLVPLNQHVALLGKYQATEGELAAVSEERDRLLAELERTRERLLEAEKSASRAEGELDAYKSKWWRNVFRRNE